MLIVHVWAAPGLLDSGRVGRLRLAASPRSACWRFAEAGASGPLMRPVLLRCYPASQTAPGRYNEAALRGLDYLLDEARKAGIRVSELQSVVAAITFSNHRPGAGLSSNHKQLSRARCRPTWPDARACAGRARRACRCLLRWVVERPRSLPHPSLLRIFPSPQLVLAFTSNWTPTGGVPEYLKWCGSTDQVRWNDSHAGRRMPG